MKACGSIALIWGYNSSGLESAGVPLNKIHLLAFSIITKAVFVRLVFKFLRE